MKFIILSVSAAACLCAISAPAAAQIVVEGNAARADSQWGVELGAGYDIAMVPGFTLRPGGGVLIYAGENDRYRTETIAGGTEICRDLSNGQFADSEDCDNTEIRAYARLEATYTILGSAELGVGGRYSGDDVQPYGTVSFPIAPRIRIKANAGDDYYALGLRASF
ncbi:hypothetical protein [Aurantiacibacter sp. MUD61]|uniref:hypothetical protein n=1 Tax=Aurantiacibacter sp. MUD61 TaxID=3009083 RepID=UPI0022F0D7E7|nr:hypothetical protein [Aurantiacibacter sp. MUD61]